MNLKKLKEYSKKLNVLYVEDDENSLQETASLLEMIFNRVDTATNGEEGLKKYKENRYDLVITDISMPKMNGIEMIKKIKQIKKEQKILIISAHSDVNYLLPLINLNVNGFILKPINPQIFFEKISEIVELIVANKIIENFNNLLTRELEEKTKELAKKYIYDDLTNLLNRKALNEELKTEKEKSLIIIDIKDFGSINFVYGYEIGDNLLKEFASFLKNIVDDKIFYLESDKFAIITKKEKEEIKNLAEKIIDELKNKEFFQINNDKIYINVSIAIAYKTQNLLKKARIALEELKKEKNNSINFYHENSPLEKFQKKIQQIKPIILQAIKNDNIIPFYQPIYNNKTQKIEKYEVLARIMHNNELIPPSEFIEVTEHLKLMPEITQTIIKKALDEFKNSNFEISINISEIDIQEEYLHDFLNETTKKFNFDKKRIVLEFLEDISSLEIEKKISQIQNLQNEGYKIAIDDFGTKNSNFEKLLSLKIDYLKIDGKFIKNIQNDQKSLMITKAIKNLANTIGTKTIAEFVHNKETFDIVNNLEIDYSQGYYISKPLRNPL